MKLWTYLAIGAGVVGIVAVASIASAKDDPKAADKPDPDTPDKPERKIRHGIAHEGCDHFEVVDEAAIKAWGMDNKLTLMPWVLKMASVKKDPEPALVELLGVVFPECSWPPPAATTFGPQRGTWGQTVDEVRKQLANYDSTTAPGMAMAMDPAVAGEMLLGAVSRGFGGAR
ncbi:MAG: hypothetical protein K0V04_02960 [Deltaproteobacteria bacterium]|nr:hypothetical protein [Deltaproteobacteria bacterium]